jgi:putative radical SAM enzyme (TIGR03279 family)
MPESELRRVIELRVSPLNVSVHTMAPALRAYMLGNKAGAHGVSAIRRLARAGILMNCQIVVCPGVNDGAELDYSMDELRKLYPSVHSVSVVPVGLTRHREGLPELTAFDAEKAREVVAQVEAAASKCRAELGSGMFFAADELYIKAGLGLPPDESYEDYPQLENGVGMMRSLITEFDAALENADAADVVNDSPFTAVTGRAAEKFIAALLDRAREKLAISGDVAGVTNDFFGDCVDVAGLVTGGDIISALKARGHAPRLLIPENMLRRGEDMFLDGVTVGEMEKTLGVAVRVVRQDGADLLRAMMGE